MEKRGVARDEEKLGVERGNEGATKPPLPDFPLIHQSHRFLPLGPHTLGLEPN